MDKNKKYFRLLRIFGLFFCMSFCLMTKKQIVKADLVLDGGQIDGSCAIFFDGQPLREIQYNGIVVWRAGADIAYRIDSGIYEIHFVPYGQTTLSVTGSKEGYEFVGWRKDTTASGDVLGTDLCTGDAKTLYAVFRKRVTVTYYNGSSTPQTSAQYIYYNNGNISYPEFTIAQASLNGWTNRGWTTGKAADAEIKYQKLDHTVLTADMTLYGAYQKTITASFDGNGAGGGSTAALTGTAYYNSAGNTTNPSFRMPDNGYTKSGYAWSGWMQGGTGVVRSAGETITLTADTTFSAVWEPTTIYLSEYGVSATYGYNDFPDLDEFYESSFKKVQYSKTLPAGKIYGYADISFLCISNSNEEGEPGSTSVRIGWLYAPFNSEAVNIGTAVKGDWQGYSSIQCSPYTESTVRFYFSGQTVTAAALEFNLHILSESDFKQSYRMTTDFSHAYIVPQ